MGGAAVAARTGCELLVEGWSYQRRRQRKVVACAVGAGHILPNLGVAAAGTLGRLGAEDSRVASRAVVGIRRMDLLALGRLG